MSKLHQEFKKIGRARNELTYKLISLLPEIYRREIYKRYAASIYEYAGKYGGLSRGVVEKTLRTYKHLEDKPILREKVKTEGIHKVSLVATLATQETDKEWSEKVETMSKATLLEYAKEMRTHTNSTSSNCYAKSYQVTLNLEGKSLFLFQKLKQKLEKAHLQKFSNAEAIEKILSKLDDDSSDSGITALGATGPEPKNPIPGNDLAIKNNPSQSSKGNLVKAQKKSEIKHATRVTRYIPSKFKKHIIAKYHGKCAYPNCNKPYAELHHRIPFAIAKSHESIIPLCNVHHQMLHSGTIQNPNKEPSEWKISTITNLSQIDQKIIDHKILEVRC